MLEELFLQIDDVAGARTGLLCLLLDPFEFVITLADVTDVGDDFAVIVLDEPRNDGGGVDPHGLELAEEPLSPLVRAQGRYDDHLVPGVPQGHGGVGGAPAQASLTLLSFEVASLTKGPGQVENLVLGHRANHGNASHEEF